MNEDGLLSIDEFAETVKSKYPEYKDIDNATLAAKVIEKYPEYKDKVRFEQPQEELTPEMMETGQRDAAPAYAMTEEKYAAEKKSPTESPLQDGVSADVVEEPVVEEPVADKESLSDIITPKLMGKEEQEVVPFLNYQFGDEGFKFERSGIGDAMVAKSIDDEGNVVSEEEFDLDPFLTSTEVSESKKLQDWMSSQRAERAEAGIMKRGENQLVKFRDRQQINTTLEEFSKEQEAFAESNKGLIADNMKYQEDLDKYNSMVSDYNEANIYDAESEAKIKAEADRLQVERDRLVDIEQGVKSTIEGYQKRSDLLKRSVGSFDKYIEGIDTPTGPIDATRKFIGGFYDNMIRGIGEWAAGEGTFYVETALNALPVESYVSPDIIEQQRKEGLSDSQIKDEAIRTFKKELLPAVRTGMEEIIGSDTTEEYVKKIEGGEGTLNFILGSVLGSAKSTPIMALHLASALSPMPAGKGGKALTVAQRVKKAFTSPVSILSSKFMGAQVADALDQEMANSPAFEGVSENEKMLIKYPVAIVSGILENYGASSIVNKTGIPQKLTLEILKKMGKGASAKTFKEFAEKEIKSRVARGGITLLSGAATEFETGALQELATVSAKKIYSTIKEQEMFPEMDEQGNYVDSPKLLSMQMAGQILDAAAREAIGGGFFSTIPALSSALSNDYYFNSISDEQFELFNSLINTKEGKIGVINDLKNKITAGEITQEDGKRMLDDVNKIQAALDRIPSDYSAANKKKALSLIMRQDAIKRDVAGKDENLTKRQRAEIEKINQMLEDTDQQAFLEKERQDAIQEPSTETVDVQEPAADSEEVGEGDVREVAEEIDTEDQVAKTEEEIAKEEFDKFNAIIDGKKPRLRKGIEEVAVEDYVDVEKVTEQMNQLDPLFVNYTTPKLSEEIEVKPISEATDTSPIPQEILDEYGVKDATELEKPIESFEGIPMVRGGMTDMLAGGKIKDSMGNDMQVGGGIMFSLRNVLNKGLAWAGIDRKGAETQYNDAVNLYNDNKQLFERLWKEGKLPNGHVPMTITKMGDNGVNSNEAVFRYVLPKIKSVPLKNRQKSFDALVDRMFNERTKKDGTILPPLIKDKVEAGEEQKVTRAEKIRKLIDDYNVTTMDGFLEAIIKDANLRAKEDSKAILALDDRAKIFEVVFSKGAKTGKGNTQPHSTALFEGRENDPFLLNTQNVYDAIAENSLRNTPKGYVVAIVGIDVLNGGVGESSHQNYGFGPKGRPIALITNPRHQADIFPEMTARAAGQARVSVSKKGESVMESIKNILGRATGQFFNILPAQGQKVRMKVDTVDQLIGLMRLTFPSVQAYTSQAEFNDILEDPEVREQVVEGLPILGITKDNKIYINPDQRVINTPIHEFGHIWTDMLRMDEKGRELLAKGLSFVDSDPKAYNAAVKKYAEYDSDGNMTNEELVREEALVAMIAAKGEGIVDAAQKSDFKTWLKAVMEYVKKYLKGTFTTEGTGTKKKVVSLIDQKMIDELTLDQFTDMAIADLFSGNIAFKQPKLTQDARKAKARMSKDAPIKATVDFRSRTGRTFSVSKEFRNQQHLDNYIKLRERKGDKEIGVTIGEVAEVEAPKPQKRRFAKKAVIKIGNRLNVESTLEIGRLSPIMIDGQEFARMTDTYVAEDSSRSESDLYTISVNAAVSEGLGGVIVSKDIYNPKAVDTSLFSVAKSGDSFVITPKKSQARFSKAGINANQNTLLENVQLGREAGISDAVIKDVLRARGFKVADINKAMEVKVDVFKMLPASFRSIGLSEGLQLFNRVEDDLRRFVSPRRKPKDFIEKTPAEIREQAIELLINDSVFKEQTEAVQEKMIAEFDKALGIKANDNVQKFVQSIKESIKGRKKGVKDVETAQAEFRKIMSGLPKDIKAGPQVKKLIGIVGKINPENIVSSVEKAMAVVDEISAKDAKTLEVQDALRDRMAKLRSDAQFLKLLRKDLVKFVREYLPMSSIYSKKQLTQVASIMSNLNINNYEKQSQKIIDLIEGQMNKMRNAEVKKALALAKKNSKTKLGVATGLRLNLDKMLAISPSLIPDSVFETYAGVVKMIGQRKAVLDLKEINETTKDVDEVLQAVNDELSLVPELTERFESFEDKVEKDGKVSYSETIKKMVDEGVITDEEASVMKRYKSDIVPVEPSEKMSEAEIQEEKEALIEELSDVAVDSDRLSTKDERDIAAKLAELIKTNAVDKLNNAQLKQLLAIIDNINNGYFPHAGELMVERLNANNRAESLAEAISQSSPQAFSKLYAKMKNLVTAGDNSIYKMIERNPLAYVDQVFGDFKSKRIYNSLFKPVAEAYSSFETDTRKVNEKLRNAEEKLAKSFKLNPNETLKSKYRIMTYMLQLEYESNIGNKQVAPAADFLRATINNEKKNQKDLYEKQVGMLQEILDEYSDADGNIDADKLFDGFSKAEKEAVKAVQEVNQSLTDKAVYTSAVIRGDAIQPLTNYVHRHVVGSKNMKEDTGASFAEAYSDNRKPSTKAKTLLERTTGASPISFDVFSSTQRGAKMTLLDYHMTEPVRTGRKTLNSAKDIMSDEDGVMPKKETQVFQAIEKSYEQVLEDTFTQNFTTTTIAEDAIDYIKKVGYRAILADVPRMGAELMSNVLFATTAAPKEFATGVKMTDIVMSPTAVQVMENVGSAQTSRIYAGDSLSGRLIDTQLLNQASGVKVGSAKSDVMNRMQQISNLTGKRWVKGVEFIADSMISTPDKAVMRPVWFGTFATEFKKLTGTDPDFDLIGKNDEKYLNKYKDAIKGAKDKADDMSVLVGASDNPFMGIQKGKIRATDSAALAFFKQFNSFMSRFLIYEYAAARTGINAAVGNGMISKTQGAQVLGAVAIRMTAYTLLSKLFADMFVNAVTGIEDEEEDEKTISQRVQQALASSFVGLVLGRDFGNVTKSVINFGAEKFNEEFLESLRNGDYNQFRDAIAYSIIPPSKEYEGTELTDILKNMLGPYGPAFKMAETAVKKGFGAEKKTKEAIERQMRERTERIPLEVLGNLGLVPFYKDIRRILLKEMYKDIGKKEGRRTLKRRKRKRRERR